MFRWLQNSCSEQGSYWSPRLLQEVTQGLVMRRTKSLSKFWKKLSQDWIMKRNRSCRSMISNFMPGLLSTKLSQNPGRTKFYFKANKKQLKYLKSWNIFYRRSEERPPVRAKRCGNKDRLFAVPCKIASYITAHVIALPLIYPGCIRYLNWMISKILFYFHNTLNFSYSEV